MNTQALLTELTPQEEEMIQGGTYSSQQQARRRNRRNLMAFRNMPAGSYSVKYMVSIDDDDDDRIRIPFSPNIFNRFSQG